MEWRMALKSSIFKADIQITDLDRHYYADHALTIARHPSENDERMMVRVLAFILYASETLQLGKGLSTEDEPDIWQKNYSDEIELWIDLGQPDEKRIRKACGRAARVVIVNYQERSAAIWREQNRKVLARFDSLEIISIPDTSVAALAAIAQRAMRLQCTIQDGTALITDGEQSLEITPERLKAAA